MRYIWILLLLAVGTRLLLAHIVWSSEYVVSRICICCLIHFALSLLRYLLRRSVLSSKTLIRFLVTRCRILVTIFLNCSLLWKLMWTIVIVILLKIKGACACMVRHSCHDCVCNYTVLWVFPFYCLQYELVVKNTLGSATLFRLFAGQKTMQLVCFVDQEETNRLTCWLGFGRAQLQLSVAWLGHCDLLVAFLVWWHHICEGKLSHLN